jgi:hypothetical protein
MPESVQTRLLRWRFNLFPAYRGTGARVTHIASDFAEVRVELPLSWRTRNYVGTIFGGSMYGAVDPMFMIMLIRLLGPGYIVWDKSASIRFRRPGRTRLHATVRIPPSEVDEIRAATAGGEPIDRVYHVDLVDAALVHATVEKVVYVRRKSESASA